MDAGDALAFDALLHKMVHAWQTVSDNREPGYAGHGPKFAAKCNEIGQALGLGPVGVKGRTKGRNGVRLPDCAQWPLNVRPEGYYGDAPRAQKAVGRATKAPAPKARRPSSPAPAADPLELARLALQALDPEQRAILASEGWLDVPAPRPTEPTALEALTAGF